MFREIGRPKQALAEEEVVRILQNGKTCIVAVSGDDGYPYAVPLNYVYKDNKIYFHCAKEGHKLDAIKRDDKVSFCVIEKDDVDAGDLNTDFISVIAFGRARILTGDEERMHALNLIGDKYSFDFPEEVKMEIANEWDNVALVEIRIEKATGKAGSNLI